MAGCGGTSSRGQAEARTTATTGTAYVAYTRYAPGGRREVWLARADGSGKRRLAAGRSPSISPDGRWVAYYGGCQATGECRQLMLIASSGGRPQVLARSGDNARWSPDGKRLVFVTGDRLVRFEPATRRRGDIASASGLWDWSFSPSGAEIAYDVLRSGNCYYGSDFDIFVVTISNGKTRRLTTDGCSASPVWGVSGIAFARLIPYRTPEGFLWGRHEIWRVDPDGTGRRTITGRVPTRLLGQGVYGLAPVAWSADGRRLLAGLQTEFGDVPFAVDPERGTLREIDPNAAGSLDLSDDGRYVLTGEEDAGSDARSHVTVLAYRGGGRHVIVHGAAEASWNR